MAWDNKSFGECAELIKDTVQPGDALGLPYIGLEHISQGQLSLLGFGKSDDVISAKSRFRKGDILFGKLRPYFRKVILAPFDGICSTDIWVVRAKRNVDQKFLFYWMASEDFVESSSRASEGTKMPRAQWEFVERIKQEIPPLPEQRAIAGILGALDDKIELNRRMNQTLESMARAVFRQWFLESEEVEGWNESSLDEIFGKKRDCVLTGPFGSHLHAHDYRDEGTPLILVKHVMDGHILEDSLPMVGAHKLREMERYVLEVGDIVFTRVGAVGRSAYVHPRNKGWLISGQTLRVRVPDKTKLNPRYLAQIYLEPSFIDMVEQHALGTTRPSLNTSILSSFKFALPPIEMQNKFGEFADAIDKKIQQNLDESRTLASLRDALLPKLMRGEVRVKTSEQLSVGSKGYNTDVTK